MSEIVSSYSEKENNPNFILYSENRNPIDYESSGVNEHDSLFKEEILALLDHHGSWLFVCSQRGTRTGPGVPHPPRKQNLVLSRGKGYPSPPLQHTFLSPSPPPRRYLGQMTGVPLLGKDMGPVEVLWDGDGVPLPRCEQTDACENSTLPSYYICGH